MNKNRMRPTGRIFNLVRGSSSFQIKNQDTSTTKLYLYDEISYYGVTAADFVRALQDIESETIELHINSPGGDAYEGLAILNSLRQHKSTVNVTIDGLAASAASFIAMAGDTVTMAKNSELMIHDAFGLVMGNADDFRDMSNRLDKVSDNIASIYADKAGGSVEDWRKEMRAETWYSADEAVSAGLADRVIGTASDIEDAWDLSIYNGRKSQAPIAAKIIPEPAKPAIDFANVSNLLKQALKGE